MIISSIIAALAAIGLFKSEWRPKLADTLLFVDTLIVWGLLIMTPLMEYGPRVANTPGYSYDPPATWVILTMLGLLVLLLVGLHSRAKVIRGYVINNSWFWLANALLFSSISIGALTGNYFTGVLGTNLSALTSTYAVLFLLFSALSVLNFSAYYKSRLRPLATRVFFIQLFFVIVIFVSAIGFLLSPEPDSACPDLGECLSPTINSTSKGIIVGLFTAGFVLLFAKDAMKRALKRAHPIWFIMGAVMAALALPMLVMVGA